jgi:hypothetical protein
MSSSRTFDQPSTPPVRWRAQIDDRPITSGRSPPMKALPLPASPERSPFMPVRRTDSPDIVDRSSRDALQRMGQAGGRTPGSPLTAANVNTLPDLYASDMFVKRLEAASHQPRSRPTSVTSPEHVDATNRPVVVRAKISTAAVPRRKGGLVGAERADPAPPLPSSPRPKSSLDVHPPSGPPPPRSKSSMGRRIHTESSSTRRTPEIPDTPRFDFVETEVVRETVDDAAAASFGQDGVNVCVRVRPPNSMNRNAQLAEDSAWDVDEKRGTIGNYAFDTVVTGSDNEPVYACTASALVTSAMEGYNALVFAYGQTASGKTFTLVRLFCLGIRMQLMFGS